MENRKSVTIAVLAAVFAVMGGRLFADEPAAEGETPVADEPAAEGETPVADEWAVIIDESRPEGLHSYDVGDYVQDGLVGHFDAIRNAGADLPHDANATTWKNLVAGAPDARLTTSAAVDPARTCHWMPNAYRFNLKSSVAPFEKNTAM